MIDAVYHAVSGPRLLPRLGRLWRHWGNQRNLARACSLVPDILATVPPQPDAPPPTVWSIHRAKWTETGVAVIAVGPAQRPPTAVLKLAQRGESAASLRRQETVLAALRADPRLGEWRALLPKLLAQGEIADQIYAIEQALPGCDAQLLLTDPAACMRIQMSAAATIGQLHLRTAVAIVVDAGMVERWIDQPLGLIRRLSATLPLAADHDAAIRRLVAELHTALIGRTLSVSWIHGDFWPGNMLVTPDGERLTGIVDWDLAAPNELRLHDVLHLLLYTRKLARRCELGDVVRELLDGAVWTAHERAVLEAAQLAPAGDDLVERAMVLVYWLRHITANLMQSTAYARNWLWVRKNIEGVLRCV